MTKFLTIASLAAAAFGFVAIPGVSAFAAGLPPLSLTQSTMNANYAYEPQAPQARTNGITEQSQRFSDSVPSFSIGEALRSHPNEPHHSGHED